MIGSPVGFKGNLSLRDICLFLSRGLGQMEGQIATCAAVACGSLCQPGFQELQQASTKKPRLSARKVAHLRLAKTK